MNAGIIGVDCFLSSPLLEPFDPLIVVFCMSLLSPFTRREVLMCGGISTKGEVAGLLSEGVSICTETVVLELDRE